MVEPEQNGADQPSSSSSALEEQLNPRPKQKRTLYVSPPHLPEAEKLKYQSLVPSLDLTIRVDEIVGEAKDDLKGPLYYGRYAGGIIYGFPAKAFSQKYPELIAAYERKKEENSLAKFDPSSSQVHPQWRIKLKITISKHRASVSASSAYGSDRDEDSDALASSEDEVSDDLYSEEGPPTRRSARQKAKASNLPFSPRKTRSTAVYPVLSDDEDSNAPGPRRRSARNKPTKIPLEDEDSENDSDDYVPTRRPKVGKARKTSTRKKSKPTRPAYGLFRSTAELDDDYDSDTKELRGHWKLCAKCHMVPAHELVAAEEKRSKKGQKRRRKTSDDEFEEEVDAIARYNSKGGWVRCLNCPVSVHWSCLARADQEEILKAARERDRAEWIKAHEGEELNVEKDGPRKRSGLDINQITDYLCNYCAKGGMCMGCLESVPATSLQSKLEESVQDPTKNTDAGGDTTMEVVSTSAAPKPEHAADGTDFQLLFRCFTCKRLAHYKHIEPDITDDDDLVEIASHYQANWLCADCGSYHWGLDKILAWRPYPANAIEPPHPNDELPNIKEALPREYLVKWQERGYRRTSWVPHMWLVSTHSQKLKNFIAKGTQVELLLGETSGDDKVVEEEPSGLFDVSRESSPKPPTPKFSQSAQSALVDAEAKIPIAWKTVDRVLDVQLRAPPPPKPKNKRKGGRRSKGVIESESDVEESESDEAKEAFTAAFEQGEEPVGFTESVDDFEERTGDTFNPEQHIDLVVWAFFKWNDLGYEEATWDSPPRPEDPTYSAFRDALGRFSMARQVQIPKRSKNELALFVNRKKGEYRKNHVLEKADDLDLGQDPKLRLMPFQVDGFNWLCNNWWERQTCILADEMGLGKTVQIASFIGRIVTEFQAAPALVVVPNSTITNWVREFERWAPKLRVVPFYGEAKARDVLKKFELQHSYTLNNTTGAKFHVLITTYEAAINSKDFGTVFKKEPRWETLVIDEGQRLKSDSSLLFRKLNELNTGHRIIMTGTPLNNNIRELFNLMNFLDPDEWNDLPALEQEYEDLNEDLVKQLHNRLRPYFLRRIKSEVLDLPPKNEVIVPLSMAPLQKTVYRNILSHNVELLQGLMQPTSNAGSTRKLNVKNMLMQLRKSLQHPYLFDREFEPRGLPPQETHDKLIDGSAKLRFLKDLLPKLKARGHRVLIFSQFVIALDIIEDFLVGEGHKFLRLDGNTKGSERQKGMDEFNRPDSPVFVYILSTRAGVGINLFTADTVIIFDPDFNPHQDLQAIARAHRFGQKKTCLVFKLMVKDSAEERIMQIGKKKLVLDHLIVQKMDDDENDVNFQSILTYGAQQLFDGTANSKDIVYSETDIDNLILKTEKEGDQEQGTKEGAAATFSFAKIWTADKDELEEVADADDNQVETDSWAQTLAKINEERLKKQAEEEEKSGRSGRRQARKAAAGVRYTIDFTPQKKSRKTASEAGSVNDEYEPLSEDIDGSESSGSDGDGTVAENLEESTMVRTKKGKGKALSEPFPTAPAVVPSVCGLCGQIHGPKNCPMTESSDHLVEYREMLILHTEDESFEQRCAAVNSIDEVLRRRGHERMIYGQPLYPVRPPRPLQPMNAGSAAMQIPRPRAGPSMIAGPSKQHAMTRPAEVSISGSSGLATTQPTASVTHTNNPSAIASTSKQIKRPSSPSLTSAEPLAKKSRPSTNVAQRDAAQTCAVCSQSPLHLLRDCPIVHGSLPVLLRRAEELSRNPIHNQVAASLRRFAETRRLQEANAGLNR